MKSILLFALLLSGCTDNGRYQTTQGEGRYFVTDTRTGAVYIGSLPYGGAYHQADTLMLFSKPVRQR